MLKRIFFETKMTWTRVIILSILCGIIPGVLMIPKALLNTSFQQPGISYEFWILMAMYIILNCKTPQEAGFKTFIFFLISQPLIYLVQVPYYYDGWKIFNYYPFWAVLTVLTLPGGMIAWYTKKNKWYSIPILMVACIILIYELPMFAFSCYQHFPKMSLACLFIIALLILFPYLLFEKKSYRMITWIIICIFLIAASHREYQYNIIDNATYFYDLSYEGPYTVVEDGDIFSIDFEGNEMHVNYNIYRLRQLNMEGKEEIIILDGNGQQHQITVEYHYEVVLVKEN